MMRTATNLARLCLLFLLYACAEQEPPLPPLAEAGAPPAQSFDAMSDAVAEPPQGRLDAADAGAVGPRPRVSLVVHENWMLLGPALDPFDDRLPSVECLDAGVVPETLSEERALGVETGWCNYLTALQPTRREVEAGEVLKVRLWHFELSAPEPAEAHAVVMVDGLRVLDERVPIPSPGGLLVRQLRVEHAIPAGAKVYFHLHNHGANSWALVEVSAGPG